MRQLAEHTTHELYSRIAHRYRTKRDARLRAHALARGDGPMKQQIQYCARGLSLACQRIGLLDLTQDLPLTDHQGIQARSHPKQMIDALFIFIGIQIFADILLVARKVEQELPHGFKSFSGIIHHRIELTAIAGGQHCRLIDLIVFMQMPEPAADVLTRDRKPLAHRHRCRFMIESQNH